MKTGYPINNLFLGLNIFLAHTLPPFLIFWPHPSIYAVNSNRNWPKTRKYPSLNRGNFKV